MANEEETQETHQNPETEESENTEEETEEESVTLSKSELEDLKKRAEVSSQNFVRLKKAEARLQELESLSTDDISTEEEKELHVLQSKLANVEQQLEKSDVITQYPVLKDVWSEFEEYRASDENAGMSIKTAAKAFLVEKDLTDSVKRKGLEKVRGGHKTPPKSGISADEIAEIRKNNQRKYRDMLKKGQIKFSS